MNDSFNDKKDDLLGCSGEFDIQNIVCKKICALRLRCLIDSNQDNYLEFIEDLISCEFMTPRMQ